MTSLKLKCTLRYRYEYRKYTYTLPIGVELAGALPVALVSLLGLVARPHWVFFYSLVGAMPGTPGAFVPLWSLVEALPGAFVLSLNLVWALLVTLGPC